MKVNSSHKPKPSSRALPRNARKLTDRRKAMIQKFFMDHYSPSIYRDMGQPAWNRGLVAFLRERNSRTASRPCDVECWLKAFPEFFEQAHLDALKMRRRSGLESFDTDSSQEESIASPSLSSLSVVSSATGSFSEETSSALVLVPVPVPTSIIASSPSTSDSAGTEMIVATIPEEIETVKEPPPPTEMQLAVFNEKDNQEDQDNVVVPYNGDPAGALSYIEDPDSLLCGEPSSFKLIADMMSIAIANGVQSGSLVAVSAESLRCTVELVKILGEMRDKTAAIEPVRERRG